MARDVAAIADAFGEIFLYYDTINPATGSMGRKVSIVQRVTAWPATTTLAGRAYTPVILVVVGHTAYGIPILVGAGYFVDWPRQRNAQPSGQG